MSRWLGPVVGAIGCALASCGGSAGNGAMTVSDMRASRHTGSALRAEVGGGGVRSGVLVNVPDEDFKQALESSLVSSGLFRNAGNGGYQIDALITSVEQPAFGLSMRVRLEVGYTLRRSGKILLRKNIVSTYTAPVGEAFSGAVRLRKATEGAARENIRKLIATLDQTKF